MTPSGDHHLEIEEALGVAKERVVEVVNLELAMNTQEELADGEAHLVKFAVTQGWLTCLEYLSDLGLIDIHLR